MTNKNFSVTSQNSVGTGKKFMSGLLVSGFAGQKDGRPEQLQNFLKETKLWHLSVFLMCLAQI